MVMNGHVMNIKNNKIKNGSLFKLGTDYSINISVDKHLNWCQKKMFKLCFGFIVTDYIEE